MDPRIVSRTEDVDVRSLSRLMRSVADHCAARMVDGAMPRAALDPVWLPPDALPWIMLFEVLDGMEFRVRLQGTALRDAYGLHLKGTLLRDIETWEPVEESYARFAAAVTERRMMASVTDAVLKRAAVSYERLLVPLSRDDGGIGFLLVCLQLRDFPRYATVLDLVAAGGVAAGR